MSDSLHPSGVETRNLASGWQGVAHHGDGTCTKAWAPTEDEAEREATELIDR